MYSTGVIAQVAWIGRHEQPPASHNRVAAGCCASAPMDKIRGMWPVVGARIRFQAVAELNCGDMVVLNGLRRRLTVAFMNR